MAWGKNGTPSTGSGASLTISDLTKNKFNQFMCHMLQNGNVNLRYRIGNGSIDTGSNYADRLQYNGGTDILQTSQTDIHLTNATASDIFSIVYLINISGEEKLIIGSHLNSQGTGAGSAPNRMESVNKYTVTTDQIDQLQVLDESGTEIGSNSNLSALGSEITPAAAVPAIDNVQDNSLFVEKENARRYWFDGTNWTMQPTKQFDFSSSTGWVSNNSAFAIDTSIPALIANNESASDLQVGYDLTSISDTAWVIDFDLKIVSLTSAGSLWTHIGMFSVDTTVDDDQTQNFLGLILKAEDSQGTSSDALHLADQQGGTLGTAGHTTFGENSLNGTPQFYLRMKRTASDKLTLENYSSSARVGTPSTTVTRTLVDNPQSLRYFKVTNRTAGGTSPLNIKIENLKIYKGVTSVN